jgi:hypothetical protein
MNEFASQAGHWYARDGSPQYTIVGANGAERNTTLRDARKFGYLPSVTSIIKCASAPGLEQWKANQLLLAGLTLPREKDESEKSWLSRVSEDSKQQAAKAAERGTAIHAAIERSYGEEPAGEFQQEVWAARKAVDEVFAGEAWLPEKSFASPLGYGGKVDLHSANAVVDFKTKDGCVEEVELYDEHHMQLAAYAAGLELPAEARCAIVFVSRTLPGKAKAVVQTEEDRQRGWQMFEALLAYWQAKNDYRP